MNVLPAGTVRRLARAYARCEGAQQACQAAEATYRTLTENFSDALRSACEDHAIELPPPNTPSQVNVDWTTGEVKISVQPPAAANGVVAEGMQAA